MDSSRHGVETIARRVSKWHPACGLLLERRIAYGREGDDETSSSRQARRKSRDDAGGRIRARGDAPHPGRQAWRPIDEAGDCDRSFESATCGRQVRPPAFERKGEDEGERHVRVARRKTWNQACLAPALPCGEKGTAARRPNRGVAQVARASGAHVGAATVGGITPRLRAASGADQGAASAACRGASCRPNTAAATSRGNCVIAASLALERVMFRGVRSCS